MIIPWPPGGSTDVLARLVCEQLSVKLGQNYALENRPGAGGNIGMDAIAKAVPDGYTQGPATVANLSVAQFLYAKLPFDPEKDFTVISMHWELPNVLVAPAQFTPPNTMQEFIAWAKVAAGRGQLRQPRCRHHGASLGQPVLRPAEDRWPARAVPRRGADHPGHVVG